MKSYRKYHPEYKRDETGRLEKISVKPFDLDRAMAIWSEKHPNSLYRTFVFSEMKNGAERKGFLYMAQCCGDLLEAEVARVIDK